MFLLTALLATATLKDASHGKPETFVRWIYARYERKEERRRFDEAAIFSPRLRKLIRQDSSNTPAGYVGKLDFDPLCDCQDDAGLHVEQIGKTAASDQHANVSVLLSYPDNSHKTIRLSLISTGAGWRVDDISSSSVKSLRSFLSKR